MSLEKLLEETNEDRWIALETEDNQIYHGRLQNYGKKFTKNQRNRLKRIKEELGRGEAKETAQMMEAEGDIIKFNLYNPITDEEYTVNPMSENILGTKKEGQANTENIVIENLYTETEEEALTQISPEIEIKKAVEELETDKKHDSYSLDQLNKASNSKLR